jgi:hypothetical protein
MNLISNILFSLYIRQYMTGQAIGGLPGLILAAISSPLVILDDRRIEAQLLAHTETGQEASLDLAADGAVRDVPALG